ncbi:hypothetical protein KJ632_04310, partial [Patescibacteria group bacterium]|nr:hypothetical protein [Patescibacteria group bacterium]
MTPSIKDNTAILKLNLSDIIDDIFMVLSEKEKEVVIRRFSLNNEDKQTLESIGQKFNVTRERVRQIEKIALGKLKRTVNSTKLRFIHDLAEAILKENGGLLLEETLTAKILDAIENTFEVDAHIVRLSLTICPSIKSLEKNNLFRMCWHIDSVSPLIIKEVLEHAVKELKKNKDVMTEAELTSNMSKSKAVQGLDLANSFYSSALAIDMRIKNVEEGYGLMIWRHINPKSI